VRSTAAPANRVIDHFIEDVEKRLAFFGSQAGINSSSRSI